MDESKSLDRRLQFLIVGVAIVGGGLYANFNTSQKGLLSPVVLGQVQAQSNYSPFAPLLALKSKSLDSILPDLGRVLGLATETPAKIEKDEPPKAKPTVSGSSSLPAQAGKSSLPDSNNQTPSNPSNSNVSSSATSGNSSSSNSTTSNPTPTYTNSQQAVEDVSIVVLGYLKNGSHEVLYNLMSADFKNTFSKDDFVASFSGASAIASAAPVGAPKIYGASSEWAEQTVNLTLGNGASQRYLNVYHLENRAWTLFGTEEQ